MKPIQESIFHKSRSRVGYWLLALVVVTTMITAGVFHYGQ